MTGISTIRRTNNVGDYTSVDGVVIDERKPPSRIVGIQNNKVCVIGEFERGPVGVVTAIGSTRDLVNKFGTVGPDAAGALYKGFLSLVGKTFSRLHVIRPVTSGQVLATIALDDGAAAPVIRVDAESFGVWGNALTVSVQAPSAGGSNDFNLVVKLSGETVETHRDLNLADVIDTEDLTPASEFIRTIRTAIGDGTVLVVADVALATGADGVTAASDYTVAIDILKGSAHSAIRFVYCAEQGGDATVNAALLALAVVTKTKMVLISGSNTDTVAEALTDVALYRDDRVVYLYPGAKVFIPEANGGKGGLITVDSNSWAASTLAGLDPGQNPAGVNGEPFLVGIRELLQPDLATADYESFREQGIMGVQRSKEADGFTFRSGISSTVDQTINNIARRTMADFLQESIAKFLTTFQNKRINSENKLQVKVAISDFLDRQILFGILPNDADLNDNRPIGDPALEPYEIDIDSLNSQANEALGIFVILLKVRIHATMDFIVLRTEIGETVEVTVV